MTVSLAGILAVTVTIYALIMKFSLVKESSVSTPSWRTRKSRMVGYKNESKFFGFPGPGMMPAKASQPSLNDYIWDDGRSAPQQMTLSC